MPLSLDNSAIQSTLAIIHQNESLPMTATDRLHEDLQYVASAVRSQDRPNGIPLLYFMWAAIVLVGFSLPDFAPRSAGAYWFFAGIGGGLLSWWMGARDGRRHGVNNTELGKRYGYHWLIAGVGFLFAGLPMMLGRAPMDSAAGTYLLVGGLVYALAGVHLDRPILWSGLLMLAAYVVLTIFQLPYTWTTTGVVIALSLLWAGVTTLHRRRQVAAQ